MEEKIISGIDKLKLISSQAKMVYLLELILRLILHKITFMNSIIILVRAPCIISKLFRFK